MNVTRITILFILVLLNTAAVTSRHIRHRQLDTSEDAHENDERVESSLLSDSSTSSLSSSTDTSSEDGTDEKIEAAGGSDQGCPEGELEVNCFGDPCAVSPCVEGEECTANYCGGCHAVCLSKDASSEAPPVEDAASEDVGSDRVSSKDASSEDVGSDSVSSEDASSEDGEGAENKATGGPQSASDEDDIEAKGDEVVLPSTTTQLDIYVLQNDQGSNLTIVRIEGFDPEGGSVSIEGDGSFIRYTAPIGGLENKVKFKYVVEDAAKNSDRGRVEIEPEGGNVGPSTGRKQNRGQGKKQQGGGRGKGMRGRGKRKGRGRGRKSKPNRVMQL